MPARNLPGGGTHTPGTEARQAGDFVAGVWQVRCCVMGTSRQRHPNRGQNVTAPWRIGRRSVCGVLFFLDDRRTEQRVDLPLEPAAQVVFPIDGAGEGDEAGAEIASRLVLADGVLDVPQ